ncbi:sugar phosphate nucleotidyltransferase [Halopiger djelfimassiliensis]|uniref:sugar phosphate nucleotidyltransferase n=1 Tax=Halopiger djelfimassiliensis TaxID=1293047 RepID=UPI00067825C3|nr:NDP-sugar synthase [Halopiger djelfimassiliensis]
MDAVVLAGGYATRLWPITKDRPKMLLPLGDSIIINRILAELEEDDRINDVYVSTNERFAGVFREHLSNEAFEKPSVSVEPIAAEAEKQGVVWALSKLIDREDIDDDLLIVAGDNLISFDLTAFIDCFHEHGGPTLAAYDVGSREKAKAYGLVQLEGDRVVDFQEKPDDPQSTLVSIACYALPEETLDLFDEYLAGDNNPDEPGWFIDWLQSRQSVYAFPFDGAWYDIGTPDSYLDAMEWILNGDSHVSPSATTVDCSLGENVYVMDKAILRNAELENAIIFPETEITDCSVRNAIIDQATHVKGIDLEDAVVSEYTKIVSDD